MEQKFISVSYLWAWMKQPSGKFFKNIAKFHKLCIFFIYQELKKGMLKDTLISFVMALLLWIYQKKILMMSSPRYLTKIQTGD